jgi:predicted O-methyltransferase YrrM
MELGLFDSLAAEPADAKELAKRMGTVENLTEALADVLAALNLLKKEATTYSLSDAAKTFLVSTSGAHQESTIKSNLAFGQLFENIPALLRKGASKPEQAMWHGADAMKQIGKTSFGGSLQNAVEFIAGLPEFPNFRHVCDLAGSHGFYAMALLDKNPRLQGTICDLPEVAKTAKELIADMGYADRMDTMGVDLETTDTFGQGYDLIFTSHMLYGWKDRLEGFFSRVYDALEPGGVFISNHCAIPRNGEEEVSVVMLELMTRLVGYPTHHLSEKELKGALSSCGFGNFTVRQPEKSLQHHTLILAARKPK